MTNTDHLHTPLAYYYSTSVAAQTYFHALDSLKLLILASNI